MNTNGLSVNQQVKAQGEALFVILGFRTIAGGSEVFAQVKQINPRTHKTTGPEFALPVAKLRA